MHAENGAFHRFDFEADNNDLARDHLYTVASDPSMHFLWENKPEGEIKVKFRRHYAEVWHDLNPITPWPSFDEIEVTPKPDPVATFVASVGDVTLAGEMYE
jgi:hypothetical protein